MANIMELFIKSNSKGAIDSIKKAKEETKATRTELTLMISVLSKLVGKIDKATEYAGEYTTAMRLLKTVLGDTSKEATVFIRKLSEMSGLDETTLTKQTNKFVQLGKSLNFTNEQAEQFSENLSILTTKLAMLYNIDYSTMGSSIQKAIQGTQTTLKAKTGISLNEFSEQATLNAYGINRQVSSLNDAELALVKYATILRQVTNDTEVYQNAVNSLAWQKQTLSAQVRRLATAVGQVLTPAMTTLFTVLKAIVMVITEIVKMIGALIGVNVEVGSSVGEVSAGYSDLASNIGKASSTAKKSLRSFDKLNNITTPSAGGGSGGGGLGIDSSMLGLLDRVNDNFLNIRDKATEIRDKIMEWLGFQKYIDLLTGETKFKFMGFDTILKNIWSWWKKLNVVAKIFVGLGVYVALTKIVSIGKTLITGLLGLKNGFTALNGVLLGIVAFGGGIAMFISGIKNMKENGIQLKNVLEVIGGTLLTMVGSILAVSVALGTLSGNVALVTGGIALLTTAVIGYIATFSEQNKQYDEQFKKLVDYEGAIGDLIDKEKEEVEIKTIQLNHARDMIAGLEGLVDANGKVIGSEDEVGTKLKVVNDLLGTEYEITEGYITLNGKKVKGIKELSSSVDEYCRKLRVQAQIELAQDRYLKILNEKNEFEKKYDELLNEVIADAKNYNVQSDEGYRQWAENNAKKMASLQHYKDVMETNEHQLRSMEEAGYLYEQNRYDEAMEKMNQSYEVVHGNIGDLLADVSVGIEALPRTFGDAIAQMKGQNTDMSIQVDAETTKARQKINQLFQNAKATMSVTLGFGGGGVGGGFKADGGFVNQGEVFVAREAGPEFVGTMNGRTAVANNDQIVKGIQGGVFSGMVSALRNADFGGNVTIEAKGDTEGLLNFITFKQKQINRQFN